MTITIRTFSIRALSLKGLFVTLNTNAIQHIRHSITTLCVACHNACVVKLSVTIIDCYAECHNVECHIAEYHSAYCCYAECRGAHVTEVNLQHLF